MYKSLVNTNLVNTNFTNMHFQNVPIPHLTRTVKVGLTKELVYLLNPHFHEIFTHGLRTHNN